MLPSHDGRKENVIMEIKIRNWCIKYDKYKESDKSVISGLLVYEGKIIPRWGCGMSFIAEKYGVRYDYPEVVPAYVKDRLESLRTRKYM